MVAGSRRLSGSEKKRRVLMKDWLIQKLESKYDPANIDWIDKPAKLFKISWLHASTETYSAKHSNIFKAWSKFTGKYNPLQEDPKRWKANFRCALNSLQDVVRVEDREVKKGKGAIRVYRILDDKESPVPVKPRPHPNPAGPSYRRKFPLYRRYKQRIIKNTDPDSCYPPIRLPSELLPSELGSEVGDSPSPSGSLSSPDDVFPPPSLSPMTCPSPVDSDMSPRVPNDEVKGEFSFNCQGVWADYRIIGSETGGYLSDAFVVNLILEMQNSWPQQEQFQRLSLGEVYSWTMKDCGFSDDETKLLTKTNGQVFRDLSCS